MVLTSSAGHWFQSPSVAFPLATGFSFPTRRRDEVGRVGRSVGPPTAASGVLPGENYWFIARKIEMVYLCYVDFEVSISLSLSLSIHRFQAKRPLDFDTPYNYSYEQRTI